MIRDKYMSCFLVVVMFFISKPQSAYSQSSRDSLNQYIAALQKTPDDLALRTKIILLAQTIKPAPAITDEARENYVMGITLREDKEYELSASNIKKALLIAPWWGDAYKELGLTLETAKKYNEAISAYQLYIKTLVDDELISHVKDEIAIMKAKKIKAEKEQAEANAPQAQETALLQKVAGATFTYHFDNAHVGKYDAIYEIRNQNLLITARIYSIKPGKQLPGELSGYNETGDHLLAKIPYRDGKFTSVGPYQTVIYTIQPDGKALVMLAYPNEAKEKSDTFVLPRD